MNTVQAATKTMLAAIDASRRHPLRASCSPRGETFVALLQVEDRLENPLPGMPEFRDLIEGGADAGPGVADATGEPARGSQHMCPCR